MHCKCTDLGDDVGPCDGILDDFDVPVVLDVARDVRGFGLDLVPRDLAMTINIGNSTQLDPGNLP